MLRGWFDRPDPGSDRRTTAVLGGLIVASLGLPVCGQAVFPGTTWAFKTPAELGMDAAKLNQIASTIGGNGCIVRDGYMVKTWGSQTTKGLWASASKPVVSTLLFYAIEEGRLSGVDALVRDWGWSLSAKDQPMTFRHMANMIGNYTRGEAPGAAWAYNDYNIQLYTMTLFDRVFGDTANNVALSPARLGALQFQDGSLFGDSKAYRVTTSVRDFARIGWFWANKGYWNGTQLLPQHYFDDYMKPHVPADLPRTAAADPAGDYLGIGTSGGGSDQTPYGPGIYGFNWWFNATGALHPTSVTWPDAPLDTLQANGHWNAEVMTVMPGLRLVMAYFGGTVPPFQPGNAAGTMNQVLKLLADSVPLEAPLIALNKSTISREVDFTENLPDDVFTISNSGIGTLEYQVTDNQGWLEADPVNGSSAGEEDTITISYSVSSLAVGTHVAVIEVSDNGSSPPAANSPQTIELIVEVKTVLPDFDGDGDVDQADFGVLQTCYTALGVMVSPECESTDMNGDQVINPDDLGVFLACMSGPGTLADKTCDDAFQ